MTELLVSSCKACAWRGFPERSWCPACGSDTIELVRAGPGVVEDATMLHRAPGRVLPQPVPIGTILLDGGGWVVARFVDVAPGDRVAISAEEGAPVARPEPSGR